MLANDKGKIKDKILRSLTSFKLSHDQAMAQNDIEILVKGKTSQPVIDRI